MLRGRGFGRQLVTAAMRACRSAGDATLSLRIGEGTSDAARALYRDLGFRPRSNVPQPPSHGGS